MKPIKFKGHNIIIAKDQKEYLPLPAHVTFSKEGEVVSCWRLSLWERLVVLVTGRLWFSQWSFRNPLQPQLPSVYRFKWVPKQTEKEDDHV